MRKLVCLLVLTFSFSAIAFAQSEEKSTETRIVNNKLFVEHAIKEGQTLYRLSLLYKVSVQTILQHNPKADKTLSIGQKILVPISDKSVQSYKASKGDSWYSIAKSRGINEQELIALNPAYTLSSVLNPDMEINVPLVESTDTDIATSISGSKEKSKEKDKVEKTSTANASFTHIVAQGETLYGISKKYGITQEEIIAANKGLSSNIFVGQSILIPRDKTEFVEQETKSGDTLTKTNGTKTAKNHVKKDKYLVYAFLPLYLSESAPLDLTEIETIEDYKNIKQFAFIQFYEALTIAAEDISRKYPQIKIVLKVEDVNEKYSSRLNSLIASNELKNADLIIGPFFGKEFSTLCQYADNYDIPLVNPFSAKLEEHHSHVYKSTASPYYQGKKFAQYIISRHDNAQIILVNNQSKGEAEKIGQYKAGIIAAYQENAKTPSIKEVDMQTNGVGGVRNAIVAGRENFIFTFFKGEITVTNFVQVLHKAKLDNVSLVAPESWTEYDNIETEYFMDLKTHYISQFFVDYNKNTVINFIEKFREKFAIEPSLKLFAFQGYDITYFYLSNLCENGTGLHNNTAGNAELLSTQFNFVNKDDLFFENTFTNIFKIKNYNFVEALTDVDSDQPTTNKKR